MDILSTYMMMHYLSGIGSTSSANSLSSLYSGNSASDAASTLSFLEVLQNLQNSSTGNGAAVSSSSSAAASASAASADSSSRTESSSRSRLSAGDKMDAIFERAAEKYNVNVDLLKAIGKAESNFNASAVSPAGAIGVMQLMPGTARSLGVSDPYDAEQNIMGGAKYISQMLDRYDGNAELALAAYNAGPGNVDKYGGIPPFTETQNYVERVLGYMGYDTSTEYTAARFVSNSTETAATDSGTSMAAASSASGTTEISTDTLLTLYNLMRAQMELQIANSLFAWNTDSSGDSSSSGLFSL